MTRTVDGSVVIDMPATNAEPEKQSGSFEDKFYTWLKSGVSYNQRISITPLLFIGLAAIIAGTVVDIFIKISLVGLILKGIGLGCMVAAALTQDRSSIDEKMAERETSWNKIIDRILIVTGVVAILASMAMSIFYSSSWLFLCNALAGLALIRLQSFAMDMDPIYTFKEQNAHLHEEVTNLTGIREAQERELHQLQETVQRQKEQLVILQEENATFKGNNATLTERLAEFEEELALLKDTRVQVERDSNYLGIVVNQAAASQKENAQALRELEKTQEQLRAIQKQIALAQEEYERILEHYREEIARFSTQNDRFETTTEGLQQTLASKELLEGLALIREFKNTLTKGLQKIESPVRSAQSHNATTSTAETYE